MVLIPLLTVACILGGMIGCSSGPNSARTHDGPGISEIEEQSTNEDVSKTVSFTVSDPDTPLAQLRISAFCSNSGMVSSNNIVFQGTGTERKAVIKPTPHAFGLAFITIRVSDGVSETNRTFKFNVWPTTKPPIIDTNSPLRLK